MNYNETYKLVRQYTLHLLGYPPLTEQLKRYGDLTPEEIIQEVAMDVWRHWDEDWDDGLVRFVTSRRLIDLYRRRKAKICDKGEIQPWNEPLYSLEGLDDVLDMAPRWAKLSKRDKKLIQMVVEGYAHREIANALNTTIGNSRDRLYQVRLMLLGEKPINTNKRRKSM